jgi:hypothetical protein
LPQGERDCSQKRGRGGEGERGSGRREERRRQRRALTSHIPGRTAVLEAAGLPAGLPAGWWKKM